VHEPPAQCPCPPVECTPQRIAVDLIQNNEVDFVPVNPQFQDFEALGTVFIFNDPLFNATNGFMEINNSFANGFCTRTQNNATMGNGGGLCTFVYTLTDSENNNATFTAKGEVFDFDGGILSITGGNKGFIGANGELEIIPFVGEFDTGGNLIGALQQWGGDFWDAEVYKVRAEFESGCEE
jgi:hypothetical protein